MASHAAEARIRHQRVEHIQEMASQVGAREREAGHLIAITFRATFYFFMTACLVAGSVAYGTGRHDKAALWGSIGVTLAAGWIGVKVLSRIVTWAVQAIKEDLHERKSPAEPVDAPSAPVDAPPAEPAPAPAPGLPGGGRD